MRYVIAMILLLLLVYQVTREQPNCQADVDQARRHVNRLLQAIDLASVRLEQGRDYRDTIRLLETVANQVRYELPPE